MAPPLPRAPNLAEIAALRATPERWLPAARALCAELRLPAQALLPFSDGANLVCSVDGRSVLKLYPPLLRHQQEAESAALRFLAGRVSFPVPRPEAAGEREGWPYLLMSLVLGAPLEGRWAALGADEQGRLLTTIGGWMREVHALPLDDGVRAVPPRWEAFLPAQVAGCVARHRRLGLPERLVAEIPRWLERAAGELGRASAAPRVLLTGEYTPFNLLVGIDGALSGLIDFGDAMIGPAEHDLLGPFAFLCTGQPALLRALLHGYGSDPPDDRDAARTRWLALLLLHRYSDLRGQVRVPGAVEGAADLHGLARRIWPDELWA